MNLLACWNAEDGTMDITFHMGEFSLEITKPGNPFHQRPNTDITIGKNLHGYILNFKLFNQVIQLPDIEGLRLPDFNFDFNLPVCPIRSFFFDGACTPCRDGCDVCTDDADCADDGCADPECANCDSFLPNAACNDCSGNGLA
jgi:hypothetical protein